MTDAVVAPPAVPSPGARPRWLDGTTTAMLAGDAVAATPDGRAPRTRRDWAVDVVCFLVSVGVGAVAYVTQPGSPPTSPLTVGVDQGSLQALNVTVGVVACLAVWMRRRWPVPLAVALGIATPLSSIAGAAAAIALFTVVVHRPSRVAFAVTAVHVAGGLLYPLVYPDPELPDWVVLTFNVGLLAVVLSWGLAVRSRRDLVRTLWLRAARAEADQQLRLGRAREQERARIAREMHDVLAHRLSLLSLHAGALEFRADARPDEVQWAAGVIRSSAHQALEDLREVIGVLRGVEGGGEEAVAEPPQPGLTDLPELVAEGREAGMRVRTSWDLEALATVPASTARGAFRIVQEGLTNVRKHGPGTLAHVHVAGAPGEGLRVVVENPLPAGAGVVPAAATAAVGGRAAALGIPALAARAEAIPGGGTGLVGLAERASLAGGRLEHGTHDGVFRLEARLPWPA